MPKVKQFFLKRRDKVLGPFDKDTLEEMRLTGQVSHKDLLGKSNRGPWRSAITAASKTVAAVEGKPKVGSDFPAAQPASKQNSPSASLLIGGFTAAAILCLLLIANLRESTLHHAELSQLADDMDEIQEQFSSKVNEITALSSQIDSLNGKLSKQESIIAGMRRSADGYEKAVRELQRAQKRASQPTYAKVKQAKPRPQSKETERTSRGLFNSNRNRQTRITLASPEPQKSKWERAESRLRLEALRYQSIGDTQGYLRTESAIGALAALKIGDNRMLNLFGSAAVAKARLALAQAE